MTVVVDDQVLSAELRGRHVVEGPVHTTGLWYVRLCQAMIRAQGGALSAPYVIGLPPHLRQQALAAVLELPAHIGLLSLRELGPSMGQSERNDSPRLVQAAADEGVRVSFVATT